MTRRLVDSLIAGIAPWRCILCKGPGAGIDLCRGCLRDLPWLAHVCALCGIPLPPDQAVCGRCLLARPDVDYFVAALAYEYPLDRLISALKFKRHLYVARLLGELLTLRLQEAFKVQDVPQPEWIVPVPLHPRREAQRSFNQAAEIARRVAANFSIPMRRTIITRVKNTPAQSGLSRQARQSNIRGAFKLQTDVRGRRLAIVDDVVTTGATTGQLARVCKVAGASEVQIWVVARTGI